MTEQAYKFTFGRQSTSGRAACAVGDVYISRVRESSQRESLSVRINANTMKRLGWIIGDYVKVHQDHNDNWIIERVSDPSAGLKLSAGNGSAGHAYVRFTTPEETLNQVFNGSGSSINAGLVEFKGSVAVFSKN
jgi:hypothetical protein